MATLPHELTRLSSFEYRNGGYQPAAASDFETAHTKPLGPQSGILLTNLQPNSAAGGTAEQRDRYALASTGQTICSNYLSDNIE